MLPNHNAVPHWVLGITHNLQKAKSEQKGLAWERKVTKPDMQRKPGLTIQFDSQMNWQYWVWRLNFREHNDVSSWMTKVKRSWHWECITLRIPKTKMHIANAHKNSRGRIKAVFCLIVPTFRQWPWMGQQWGCWRTWDYGSSDWKRGSLLNVNSWGSK